LLQGGVELRPLDRGRFRHAAELLQDPALGLRAGDALHLAVALHSRCSHLARLDGRLRLALAAAEGIEGAAQEVRKRLTAIDRASTFVDSAKRKALVSDLEAQLQAITGPIATGDPRQACDLLLQSQSMMRTLVLPICCRCRRPGTGKQALSAADRLKASHSKGLEPKTLIEKRKRAAGIEPASSAWKAEVLPLNYARSGTDVS
jgi:hypothetical protein